MKRLTRYLWPIALCMSVGFSASLFQREAIAEWYPFLNKPVLTPPNGAFPIVWGILYILIGISLGRIWGKGLKVSQREWWIQLALNFCWSIAFFFLREPLWGMGIIRYSMWWYWTISLSHSKRTSLQPPVSSPISCGCYGQLT